MSNKCSVLWTGTMLEFFEMLNYSQMNTLKDHKQSDSATPFEKFNQIFDLRCINLKIGLYGAWRLGYQMPALAVVFEVVIMNTTNKNRQKTEDRLYSLEWFLPTPCNRWNADLENIFALLVLKALGFTCRSCFTASLTVWLYLHATGKKKWSISRDVDESWLNCF